MLAACLTQDTSDAEQHILVEATTDLQIFLKLRAMRYCAAHYVPALGSTGQIDLDPLHTNV